mmetsp:Transcript_43356/g.134292  ORF Transcript_43356/g.134292 Transcript_43356/m.134292 type:complete len:315 (-) Transcript_43356:20-964(-)
MSGLHAVCCRLLIRRPQGLPSALPGCHLGTLRLLCQVGRASQEAVRLQQPPLPRHSRRLLSLLSACGIRALRLLHALVVGLPGLLRCSFDVALHACTDLLCLFALPVAEDTAQEAAHRCQRRPLIAIKVVNVLRHWIERADVLPEGLLVVMVEVPGEERARQVHQGYADLHGHGEELQPDEAKDQRQHQGQDIEDAIQQAKEAPDAYVGDVHVLMDGVPADAHHEAHPEAARKVLQEDEAASADHGLEDEDAVHPSLHTPGIVSRGAHLHGDEEQPIQPLLLRLLVVCHAGTGGPRGEAPRGWRARSRGWGYSV